jgi:hypothetical protein
MHNLPSSDARGERPAEVDVKSPPPPKYPDWLPEAVREHANSLWKTLPLETDPAKAQQVLEQLITNPLMKRVWTELYKKARINHKSTDQYKYPACVTNASRAARMRRRVAEIRHQIGRKSEVKALEFEADELDRMEDLFHDLRCSEQDLGAIRFLYWAYRKYLDLKPIFLSDLKAQSEKFIAVARNLREQAAALLKLTDETTARQLEKIAADCDGRAKCMLPTSGDDPWVVTRQVNDVELRVFVAEFSSTTLELFETELYGILAVVAGVVFNKNVTRSNVREILRLGLPR